MPIDTTRASGEWVGRVEMPTPRQDMPAAVLNWRLYVFGGESPLSVLEEVEEYDAATDTWCTVADTRTPRHGLSAATVGDWIYTIGGGIVPPAYSEPRVDEAFTIR